MVPAGNKAKHLPSVNHITKTIHHHHHSVARRLLPSFYCVIWKYVSKLWYLKADSVEGNVPGLRKDFAVVTF